MTKHFEVGAGYMPVRTEFEPGLYLLDGCMFRVVDLEQSLCCFVDEASIMNTLGRDKWIRVTDRLMHDGFFESGRFRIEVWDKEVPECA